MMELNEKPIREKYKEFCGVGNEQMELLIKDKRVPLTIRQICERRIKSNQNDWRNNPFDSCDACIYGKNGKFKIVKNCKIIKSINSKTNLVKGAIKITEKEYNKIKSKEFDEETTKEEIWKELLEDLFENYVEFTLLI